MTATPIPRTLAMTLYGDLDVSILREAPPGRGELSTHWVQGDKRKKMLPYLEQRLAARMQVLAAPGVGNQVDGLRGVAGETDTPRTGRADEARYLETDLLVGGGGLLA